jgi:hypothetical protein
VSAAAANQRLKLTGAAILVLRASTSLEAALAAWPPIGDWGELMTQQVIVTGVLFAAACAGNVWLAFSIPVSENAKRRPAVVDAGGPLPVS